MRLPSWYFTIRLIRWPRFFLTTLLGLHGEPRRPFHEAWSHSRRLSRVYCGRRFP